jgi:integrase
MASIELRNKTYHVVFRFGGKKYTRSLDTDDSGKAESWKGMVEETIRDVRMGKIAVPADADVAEFLLSQGRRTAPFKSSDEASQRPEALTLRGLFEQYFAHLPDTANAESTIYGMKIHQRHLERILGEKFDIASLTQADLQRFIKKREKEGVASSTTRKAIVTFRTAWNWGVRDELISRRFPSNKELSFPAQAEAIPFMTWEEVERRIERGKVNESGTAKLWDCLYLRRSEVEELLDHVQEAARHPFIYPMFVMAAHTGARRSELLRSQVIDFDDGQVTIRERKRVHGTHTTRRVSMSTRLKKAMDDWMTVHPGGSFTFCLGHISRSRIDKSKKLKRQRPEPITRDEAHDHFERTLKDSKWEKLKGWHTLRHSFISILTSEKCDQRLIDEYVGHTTDEQRRRYRHILPETKQSAIHSVFG